MPALAPSPYVKESFKTYPWFTTEKGYKCFFTCPDNVVNSRMTVEDFSLLFEVSLILKYLQSCCLANSIEAWCCVATGDGMTEKEVSANFLNQLLFDFLPMPDGRTSRVCPCFWSKMEITAIFGSMITQMD